MTYSNEQVQDLFNAAADEDLRVCVINEGEVDYKGYDMDEALDAVLAVEEAYVTFYGEEGPIGTAYILPGLDEGEQIADCSGWVNGFDK